jgi:AraC-like DNA-binding protein
VALLAALTAAPEGSRPSPGRPYRRQRVVSPAGSTARGPRNGCDSGDCALRLVLSPLRSVVRFPIGSMLLWGKWQREIVMTSVVFCSEDLPAGLDDCIRFEAWRDLFTSTFGPFDIRRATDRPFSMHSEFRSFGCIRLMRIDGTVSRIGRTARDIAASGSDDFFINLHRGPSPARVLQRRREIELAPGTVTLLTNWEPGNLFGAGYGSEIGFVLPRRPLRELVAGIEDLIARPFPPRHPIVLHLQRYAALLIGSDAIGEDQALVGHVENTIFDLIGLLLGAGRSAGQIARLRGLRAARAVEILAEINVGFADPAFAPAAIAAKLGLSTRYVQELLQETGSSFTERVLELRLQKARRMMAHPRHARRKVSDIAHDCGFNEVSYFNRCFRRRFGDSPSAFRHDKP